MSKTVLFLCTGNYYRSRFAESLFNDLAAQRNLNWRARSAGTAIELGVNNVGPISPYVSEELRRRQIELADPARMPCKVCESDLEQADLIVALKETEHRPHITARFPVWVEQITYWNVDDLDLMTTEAAFATIAHHVDTLVNQLLQEQNNSNMTEAS
jgi:protein-tyrosine phosphatase